MNTPHPVEMLLQVDPAGDDIVVARTSLSPGEDRILLGTMDRGALLRTAGVFLRRALDPAVLDALLSAAGVGLDGADEESTGLDGDALDAANDALAVLRGREPDFTLYVGGRRDEYKAWCQSHGLDHDGPRAGWMHGDPAAASGLHVKHLRVVYGSRDGYSDSHWSALIRGVDALRVGTGTVEEVRA